MIKQIYEILRDHVLFNRERKRKTVLEERKYFSNLPKAKDAFEESFFKYKCMQWYNYPRHIRFIFNLGAFFYLPYVYVYYYAKKNVIKEKKVDLILRENPDIEFEDIIPKEVFQNRKYRIVNKYKFKNGIFNQEVKTIYGEVKKRYYFNFYFRLIILLKLTEYCGWIIKYSPKIILVYACERDISLPLKTLLCNKMGVQHMGFMHGDLIYSIDKAYIEMNKFYVWDIHYIGLLTAVGAKKEQFVLYVPERMQNDVKLKDRPDFYATYYLSGESKRLLENVCKIFQYFDSKGLKCSIRPHPRYSNLKLINDIFKDTNINIEDAKKVSVESSMENTENIIGLKSTVLLQAYYGGRQIILDDLSDINLFNVLHDSGYILLKKEYKLLSDVINCHKKGGD